MNADPTSTSLLFRLRQPAAEDAWKRFVQLYTPLMQHWARRRLALDDAGADDLVQEVFALLVQRLPEFAYDKGKSFRAWLWTVLRVKWLELQRRRQKDTQADQAALEQVLDDTSAFWEADYRKYLVRRALELMQADFQPATWKACWEVVACDRPAADVARELGLTVGAVHAARFRVLTRKGSWSERCPWVSESAKLATPTFFPLCLLFA
jgi:RNA polymerase sigma-70 factor (ECF subfamily)